MTKLQREAIERHGRQLLAIFPDAVERNPVKLCQKLRRLESEGHDLALRLCNGPEFSSEDLVDVISKGILERTCKLLGNYRHDMQTKMRTMKVNIRVNRDPRGYALKIHDDAMREGGFILHKDWGGYGIIAPEFDKSGN